MPFEVANQAIGKVKVLFFKQAWLKATLYVEWFNEDEMKNKNLYFDCKKL